jgi:hypothetical protein
MAPNQSPSVHIPRSSHSAFNGYPSPPTSSSPRQEQFPHRTKAFSTYSEAKPQRRSMGQAQDEVSESTAGRGGSLISRFPGDQSHRPLDMLKHDAKLANRAPHLRKKHLLGPIPSTVSTRLAVLTITGTIRCDVACTKHVLPDKSNPGCQGF